jgi:Clostripain family
MTAKQSLQKVRSHLEPYSQSDSATQPTTLPSEEPKHVHWTVMLYIAADAILANFAIESLKQLHRSIIAGPQPSDKATVTVVVQFALDAPGGQQIPRYLFDDESPDFLAGCIEDNFNAPDGLSEQDALIGFLEWAYEQTASYTDHYALILWGHGPELLLQPPPGSPTGASNSLYLSPVQLRVALEEANRPGGKNLELVAFDACSMSMFEMAYELRTLVDYMVASQEEVPDPSFPYDSLVDLFRQKGDDTDSLIIEGVQTYVSAYQNYICNANTGMKRVTLSALRLESCNGLKVGIEALACAFLEAQHDPALPSILIEARNSARDYVGGLYVDLVEFCAKLYNLIAAGIPVASRSNGNSGRKAQRDNWRQSIALACREILHSLHVNFDGTSDGLILITSSADSSSHGVSIYFPYLSNDQYLTIVQPMVKGGRDTVGKGLSIAVNGASSGLLMCGRRDLIVLTEGYYCALKLSADTAWYTFISELWTTYLIDADPDELDSSYSAQQAAVNAARPRKRVSPDTIMT